MRLEKKNFALIELIYRFCNMIFSNYNPQSYAKMYRNFFVKRGFCRKLKITELHFWAYAMLREPNV